MRSQYRPATLTLVLGVLLIAGCAQAGGHRQHGAPPASSGVPSGAPPTAGPTTAKNGPTKDGPTPAGARPLSARQVAASTLPRDFDRTVLARPDGRALVVRGREGGCSRSTAAATRQTRESVHVTITEVRPRRKRMCTMDLRAPRLTVWLADPLGERTVVLTARRVTATVPR